MSDMLMLEAPAINWRVVMGEADEAMQTEVKMCHTVGRVHIGLIYEWSIHGLL